MLPEFQIVILVLENYTQLINHGVADEVIRDAKSDIAEFFKLPLEARKVHAQLPDRLEGYGQVFVFSESRDMRFWPVQPPSFRSRATHDVRRSV